MQLHASCVSIEGKGILLMGASGSGKSDVALRLIDSGARLVADDQVVLTVREGKLSATAPEMLQGMIEARYVGLIKLPFEKETPIVLCVDLDASSQELERLPQTFFHSFLDCSVRGLRLPAYEASTPSKIRLAMQGTLIDV